MKENPYDNSVFFAKYGEMLRSKKGLNGAGEWREFQKLLPGFAGKRVLDLGCGYGWSGYCTWNGYLRKNDPYGHSEKQPSSDYLPFGGNGGSGLC